MANGVINYLACRRQDRGGSFVGSGLSVELAGKPGSDGASPYRVAGKLIHGSIATEGSKL
jgi:hypothetical protein